MPPLSSTSPTIPPPRPSPPPAAPLTPTPTPTSNKLFVLISGNGSNLQALIAACNTPLLPSTRITRVISNRKDAYGLQRAAAAGIPTTYHNLVKYKKRHQSSSSSLDIAEGGGGVAAARAEYDRDLAQLIIGTPTTAADDERPDLVVCAGFMHVLSPDFCTMLDEAGIAVINLHPALPGRYNGAGAIESAYEDFQKGEISATGVMIHYVIAEVDMGEPIVVQEVEMRVGETKEELEKRIHEVEHGLIVEGTRMAIEKIKEKRRGTNGDAEMGWAGVNDQLIQNSKATIGG